jgi:hypothetical protein
MCVAPIEEIADQMGIGADLLEPYGRGVAKIDLAAIDTLSDRPRANYVVVSAVTPTPFGEGKTTTTVGLGQGMQRIGRSATITLRQPSMGPPFGAKGVIDDLRRTEADSSRPASGVTRSALFKIRTAERPSSTICSAIRACAPAPAPETFDLPWSPAATTVSPRESSA